MAMIDGCQIEITRWKHRFPGNAEIRLITRGLSCLWWHEKTLGPRETITPRWEPPIDRVRRHAAHALKCKLEARLA